MPIQLSEYTVRARLARHGYPDWFNPEIPDRVMDYFYDLLTDGASDEAFDDCRLVTAMSKGSYREFLVSKEYPTFWHTGYTNNLPKPEQARLFNDLRLFGAKAENTSFSLLMTTNRMYNIEYVSPDELSDHLKSSVGDGKLIEWRDDVLHGATFTYGDSQQCIMAFDFSPKALIAYAAAYRFTQKYILEQKLTGSLATLVGDLDRRFGEVISEDYPEDEWSEVPYGNAVAELHQPCPIKKSLIAAFCPFPTAQVRRNPYFEVQIHSKITPEHILETL